MTETKRTWPTAVLAAVAVGAAIAASALPGTQETRAGGAERRLCCVANPRFSGICAVELAEDETCQDVLAYLNNAASVGKTYCGSTNVRVGWKQVACEGEAEH